MARKPAHLEFVGGKGPRQRVWELIRSFKRRAFERLDVIPIGVPDDTARTYLTGLERAGYIERIPVPAGKPLRGPGIKDKWRLVRDIGIEAPRVRKDGTPVTQGLAQEQMWRTLRGLKHDINARELAANASTAVIPVAEVAASDYLRTLHAAGYLVCTSPGRATGTSGIPARYRLTTNTGPRPPMVCRASALYDPNLGKIVWQRSVTDEDAIYAR